MPFVIPLPVVQDGLLHHTSKLVAGALFWKCGKPGVVVRIRGEIVADFLGINVRTFRSAIRQLEKMGYLITRRDKGKVSLYEFTSMICE